MNTTPAPPVDDADRILLVDDDPTNLDVLRHTLDGRGYRLFVTRSGESAIEVARKVQPLLILLDVVMPGIDGYETCRRLKADPNTREAAVIFLSSLDGRLGLRSPAQCWGRERLTACSDSRATTAPAQGPIPTRTLPRGPHTGDGRARFWRCSIRPSETPPPNRS